MTNTLVYPGAVLLVLSLAACANSYDPAERAIAGGLIGAGAGAAIGAAAGGGVGVPIGLAAAAVAGAVAGAATTPSRRLLGKPVEPAG
jgi:uncharacterized protein YcfJ